MSAELPQPHNPTPLETAFDAEISIRFGTSLQPPYIDQNVGLVRVAPPLFIGDKLVTFQYTKYDPLRSHPVKMVDTFREVHGSITEEREISPDQDDIWADTEAVLFFTKGHRSGVLEAMRRMIEDEGRHNPAQAVTNPSYYIPGLRLSQWPESLEMAVFFKDNQSLPSLQPAQINHHGEWNDRRADLWVALNIAPRFEGRHLEEPEEGDDCWQVVHPRLNYLVAKAQALIDGRTPQNLVTTTGDRWHLLDVYSSSEAKPFRHQVFPDIMKPEVLIGEFGVFMTGLCQPEDFSSEQEDFPEMQLADTQVLNEMKSPFRPGLVHRIISGNDSSGRRVVMAIVEEDGKLIRQIPLNV